MHYYKNTLGNFCEDRRLDSIQNIVLIKWWVQIY